MFTSWSSMADSILTTLYAHLADSFPFGFTQGFGSPARFPA